MRKKKKKQPLKRVVSRKKILSRPKKTKKIRRKVNTAKKKRVRVSAPGKKSVKRSVKNDKSRMGSRPKKIRRKIRSNKIGKKSKKKTVAVEKKRKSAKKIQPKIFPIKRSKRNAGKKSIPVKRKSHGNSKFFRVKKSAPQTGRKKIPLSWVPKDQPGYGYKIPFSLSNGIAGVNPLLIASLGDKFREENKRGLAMARLIVTYTVKVGKKTYKKSISTPRENLDLADWFLRVKDKFDSLNYAVHGYDEMVYSGNEEDEGEDVNKRTIKIQHVLLELVNVAREGSIEI